MRDKSGNVSGHERIADYKSRLIVLCVVDDDGNQLLTRQRHRRAAQTGFQADESTGRRHPISIAALPMPTWRRLEKNSEATPIAN
jgi:hypothetical protein